MPYSQGINSNYMPQMGPQSTRSGASSTGTTSPVEPLTSGAAMRYAMPSANSPNTLGSATAGVRMNAGSPSHDYGGRLFSKRAREIQAAEGLTPNMWGPPTSGHSTPLRETIPESPNGESFPDFNNSQAPDIMSAAQSSTRRTRAGTLPSRFTAAAPSPISSLMPSSSLIPKTARTTRSSSPFTPSPGTPTDSTGFSSVSASSKPAPLMSGSGGLSRLRAGSLPQRTAYGPPSSSPFGNSLFSAGWTSNRDRSSTLASIQSQPSNAPSSPTQSFTRDLADADRTLDYLGLVESPQPPRATLGPSIEQLYLEGQRNMSNQSNAANRIRSYSVNAKEQYADEEEGLQYYNDGTSTPQHEIVMDEIRRHNMEVQAFANQASLLARPRARTAGILDMPSARTRNGYLPQPSRLDNSLTAADLADNTDYRLAEAVQNLKLAGQPSGHQEDEVSQLGPTRALWLGNIPASTTVTTLTHIFSKFGNIESARVLTHKNCGFVNFTDVESARQAKNTCNNKEIFPGNSPVRINYAKVPSASGTPGHNGLFPSPSPDPHAKAQADANGTSAGLKANGGRTESTNEPLKTPELPEMADEIVQIVKELGATDDEQKKISEWVQKAIRNNNYKSEIAPVEEPSHNRVHDAPRLRDIRKRIDNNSFSPEEIEEVAMNMLPEIAELSSDYLGNTVVQKLFEYCSEPTKEAMLREIAPHLATIGVHKNGTWAAQKVIDVARKSPNLQKLIVEALEPYTLALFYDQFGNYVVQGCLRFGAPANNFIFEAMLSHLWDLGQGRFSARAMRACLESHDATKDQQRMIAAAIALHSGQLATQQNSALLLTWFLDTCTFPKRRAVLVPRILPHIVRWCTHRLACTTVLKIVNQRNEPEAREAIINALFFSPDDQVLEDILNGDDVQGGVNLIFKTLTTPHFDDKIRADAHERVRNVLVRIGATTSNGYKRLMDEINMSTRGSSHRDQSASRTGSARDSPANAHVDPAGRPMYPGMMPGGYDPIGMQRTGSMESTGFEQYSMGMNGPMYMPAMPMAGNPQLQYQPQVVAAPRNAQYYAPQMVGFQAPVSMDAFRQVPTVAGAAYGGSPMMQPASIAPGMPMYPGPYGGVYMPQQQPVAGTQRRGRR